MALTNQQLLSLGFKPSNRGRGGLSKTKKYDSLVLPLNDTDFLYTGYNPYKKEVNYKTIWKSFKDSEGNRITYQVINLGDTGFKELKDYIYRSVRKDIMMYIPVEILANNIIPEDLLDGMISDTKELIHSSAFKTEYDSSNVVYEGSPRANIIEVGLEGEILQEDEIKTYPEDLTKNTNGVDNRKSPLPTLDITTIIPKLDD